MFYLKKLNIIFYIEILIITLISSCAEFKLDDITIGFPEETAIIFFNVDGQNANINRKTKKITITVPYGTDLTSITPNIEFLGSEIKPPSNLSRDFSNSIIEPLKYTIYAKKWC